MTISVGHNRRVNMSRVGFFALMIFVATILFSGCNIVPKSVQYQKEEERLIGSTDTISPVVEEIQIVLDGLGYEVGNTDGRMGQKTRESIKEFQESLGLKSIGYINERTLIQIEDIRRTDEEKGLKSKYGNVDVRSPYIEEIVSSGGFEPTTKDIQNALKNAGFDPGAIDGKIGPRTNQAIMEFQRTKGLKVDGKVGPQTWGELKRYLE